MSGKLDRKHRGVCDSYIGQAVDLKLCINNTTLVLRQHGKCVRRVELGSNGVGRVGLPVLVTADAQAGSNFLSQNLAEWSRLSDLTS